MIDTIRAWMLGWIESYIDTILDLLKVRAAIAYLNIVQGTRRVVIVLALVLVLAVVFACGFLIVPIALLLFMPWDPQTKAIVGIVIGGVYVLVPIVAGAVFLSEKRWMRMTRADDLLRTLEK